MITHEEGFGDKSPVDIHEWDGVTSGVILERGFGSREEGDPLPWVWWLVKSKGRYYVGTPGLESFQRISARVARDRGRLDAAIMEILP